MTKVYALQTIQRGGGRDPDTKKTRTVEAGKVFDATDDEILHLDAIGAIRKPTSDELKLSRWDDAEAADEGDRAAVLAKFAQPVATPRIVPSPKSAPTPEPKTKPLTKAEQKKVDEAAAAAAAAAAATPAEPGDGGDGGNGGDGTSDGTTSTETKDDDDLTV